MELAIDEMKNYKKVKVEEMKIEERIDFLSNKCKGVENLIKKNIELNTYKVKVADSCPLAVDISKKQKNQ